MKNKYEPGDLIEVDDRILLILKVEELKSTKIYQFEQIYPNQKYSTADKFYEGSYYHQGAVIIK